jgi:threonine dehydratase
MHIITRNRDPRFPFIIYKIFIFYITPVSSTFSPYILERARSVRQGKPVSVDSLLLWLMAYLVVLLLIFFLRLVQDMIDEIVIVSEEELVDAIRYLAVENKLVVEGAGAASLAAALKTPLKERGKTVCIVSGGSIDPEKFHKIISNKYTP